MRNSVFLVMLGGLAATASGQFYGGDFNFNKGLHSERNTLVWEAWTYDNFHWDGGPIATVYGNFVQFGLETIASAEWEIRSGLSKGNEGALVLSGDKVIGWEYKGEFKNSYEQWTLTFDAGYQFLPAGDYWVAARPVGFGTGSASIGTTDGVNGAGGPLNDDNSFFDSFMMFEDFTPGAEVVGVGQADFSYGITTPAPGAGLALIALVFARRRSRAG